MGTTASRQFRDVFDTVIAESVAVDPGSLGTGADGSTTATVTGAAVGDMVLCAPAIDMQEISYSAYVSAADTVEIVFYNSGSGTVDLASSNWNIAVLKLNTAIFT